MFLNLFTPLLAAGGTEALAEKLTSLLGGLPPIVVVFIISMIPILELRGGLIAASLLGIPMLKAVGACILGNILPIPFILLFIEKILNWMEGCKIGWMRKLALWLKARGTGPKAEKIRKYEFLGILLFVGIPLPGTGAWTGSLIAALLHVSRKKSVPAIFLGLILATIIMCLISYGGIQAIIDFF
ncbi:MAG TPA: small multi-drug export protein [Ruminococcus sp.]|nr:small multi-drug export protein [Ruminococcus sp.]